MPRALWKGSISFGLVNVPVSLLPGERRHELKFHLLDRRDRSPVRYVRVNELTGEEVPWEEIVKGYEHEKGVYVVVGDDDFRRANVKATETIEILDFVRADEVDPEFFDAPYYLEPREGGRKAYALLRETLKKEGYVGIATVVIRTRQHLAALMPRGNMLMLELLRFAYELRDPNEVGAPEESLGDLGVTDKELSVAEQLVETMAVTWDPGRYHDKYRDDLLELIREKTRQAEVAEAPAAPEPEKGAEVVDIMSLLKDSVEQAREGRADDNPGAASFGAAKTRRSAASAGKAKGA